MADQRFTALGYTFDELVIAGSELARCRKKFVEARQRWDEALAAHNAAIDSVVVAKDELIRRFTTVVVPSRSPDRGIADLPEIVAAATMPEDQRPTGGS